MSALRTYTVYAPLNRISTICGAERTLFRKAAIAAGIALYLFRSVVAGGLIFAVLLWGARKITKADPRFLKVLPAAKGYRARYDAGKRCEDLVVIVERPQDRAAHAARARAAHA